MASWASETAEGAFGSPLRLPAAGYRNIMDGALKHLNRMGFYWGTSNGSPMAARLLFWTDIEMGPAGAEVLDEHRGYGSSVRCIQEAAFEFETVTSATGRVWMDRNLGASRVALSMEDEEAYGDLYQWGRLSDGHEKRATHDPTPQTTATLSAGDSPGHSDFIIASSWPYDWREGQNGMLWQGVLGTNNPCPSGFRIPTRDEWRAEMASWASETPEGGYESPLRLTVAGYRDYTDGVLKRKDNYGFYWATASYRLLTWKTWTNAGWEYPAGAEVEDGRRAYGATVRCIQD